MADALKAILVMFLAAFLYILLIGFGRFVLADPIMGLDTLGLALQDVDMIAQEIPSNFAIGALAGTFGSVVPPLDKLLGTGKVSAFRVHLANGSCWRSHNCAADEPKPTDLKSMEARARAIEALAVKYPAAKCFLSPVLEHDVKDVKVVNSWVSLLHKVAPHCEVAITAASGYRPKGVLNEQHGNGVRGDIVSNDGASHFDSDSPRYRTNGSRLVLSWIPQSNLRVSGELTFITPKKRTYKLTRDLVKQEIRLLRPEEPKPLPPAFCPKPIEFKHPELIKTNAENHGNGDPRADKPLYIIKAQIQKLGLLDRSGKVIGCAKYFGGYGPGLYRNYTGSCDGQSGVQLMDKAGSEWGYAKGGGRCYLVNFIRRKGYFK